MLVNSEFFNLCKKEDESIGIIEVMAFGDIKKDEVIDTIKDVYASNWWKDYDDLLDLVAIELETLGMYSNRIKIEL